MNEIKLREYAKLIVKIGANVQKGQVVRLQVGVDQVPLAKMVTEECYKAGASRVELFWSCGEINKLDYQYASAEVLGEVPVWEEERTKQMVEQLPVPTYTGTLLFTISTTFLVISIFSSSSITWNSPLLPRMKIPFTPCSIRWLISFSVAS